MWASREAGAARRRGDEKGETGDEDAGLVIAVETLVELTPCGLEPLPARQGGIALSWDDEDDAEEEALLDAESEC